MESVITSLNILSLNNSNIRVHIIDPNKCSNELRDYVAPQEEIIHNIIHNTDGKEMQIIINENFHFNIKIGTRQTVQIQPINPDTIHLLRVSYVQTNHGVGNVTDFLEVVVKLSAFDYFLNVISLSLTPVSTEPAFVQNSALDPNPDQSPIPRTNIYDRCTVCGNFLNINGLNKIQTCDNPQCWTTFKHLVTDNVVSELFIKDPTMCEFLLLILENGVLHPKVDIAFKPFPVLLNITTVQELKSLLERERSAGNLNLAKIKNLTNDIDVVKTIGHISYAILKNSATDLYFSLNTIQLRPQMTTALVQRVSDMEMDPFNSPDIKFINFNYPFEIENTFKKKYFLFHGSSLACWYPIIKNGLKVMSKTALQLNGNAYGDGIYFSDNFNFSLGYASGNITQIVGVFEILEDPVKYFKATKIYVIPDDTIILLRYLVIVNSNGVLKYGCGNNFTSITNYFRNELVVSTTLNNTKHKVLKNKRLNNELNFLRKNELIKDIVVPDDDDANTELIEWKITFDVKERYSVSLTFSFLDYPRLPPRIMFNSSPTLVLNGLVDLDGKVKLADIDVSQWMPTTRVSSLVDKIAKCVNDNV